VSEGDRADDPAEVGRRGWPEGVRPITWDDTTHLGVGNDGRLYWDGKAVEVARTFRLSFWQVAFAALTVLAAVVAAGAAVVSAWADLQALP